MVGITSFSCADSHLSRVHKPRRRRWRGSSGAATTNKLLRRRHSREKENNVDGPNVTFLNGQQRYKTKRCETTHTRAELDDKPSAPGRGNWLRRLVNIAGPETKRDEEDGNLALNHLQ